MQPRVRAPSSSLLSPDSFRGNADPPGTVFWKVPLALWKGRAAGRGDGAVIHSRSHWYLCEHSFTCMFSLSVVFGAHCVLVQKGASTTGRRGHGPSYACCLEPALTREKEAGESVQGDRSGVSKLLSGGQIQCSACFVYSEVACFLQWPGKAKCLLPGPYRKSVPHPHVDNQDFKFRATAEIRGLLQNRHALFHTAGRSFPEL